MDREKSEKLQKVLANLGHGSRRELESLIEAGKISVNGKIAKLGDRVNVATHPKIRINGHPIPLRDKEKEICRVLAYYKPEGEVCTLHDPEGRATVFSRLPTIKNSRWVNIGRLDINTSGLLLFTTDGELANRLMHPKYEIEREYAVRVFGEISMAEMNQLMKGVQLDDGLAKFDSIKQQGGEGINQWFTVMLSEGRNREVRRIWEALGKQVSRLIRIRYGNINLPKRLPRGGWQELNLEDINYLRQLVGLSAEIKSKRKIETGKKAGTKEVKLTSIRRSRKRQGKFS